MTGRRLFILGNSFSKPIPLNPFPFLYIPQFSRFTLLVYLTLSHQNYVIRSNRTEGQALLSDAAARQERYYSQNPGVGYTKDVTKLGMSSANSPNNLYNLTIATPTSTTYTLTATPINSQTRDKTCGKLTLNQLGERGAAGKTGNNSTVNDCWR